MCADPSLPDQQRPWWRRIQWIDVLVVFAVMVLLILTAELWLPHYLFGTQR